MALLSLQKIHKTFEKGTVNENHVLRGLDLDIEQGDFISVIGGNGAGKSTLLKQMIGFIKPPRPSNGDSDQPFYRRKYGDCLPSW